jgi:2-haloacid dehalogenase
MPIKAIVFDAYGTLYDVASIGAAIEAVFPGRAEVVTAIWRIKQLEYSWLRTMMGRWEDFRSVTRDSLRYTLDTLGLRADARSLDELVAAQDRLLPYPDAEQALAALSGYRLAILSNGSQPMLDALVGSSGLDRYLEAVISVDPAQAFKPDPRAYALVQQRLGVAPAEVAFVTGNGFDTAGAGSFGFKVVRVERFSTHAIKQELSATTPDPAAMFRALRMRLERIGFEPDCVVASLAALPDAVPTV